MKRVPRIEIRLTPLQLNVAIGALEDALDNGWTGRRAKIAARALFRMELAAARPQTGGEKP